MESFGNATKYELAVHVVVGNHVQSGQPSLEDMERSLEVHTVDVVGRV
jgi:hypothetical protein